MTMSQRVLWVKFWKTIEKKRFERKEQVKGDEDVGVSLKDVREDRVEKKQVHDANVVETATNFAKEIK